MLTNWNESVIGDEQLLIALSNLVTWARFGAERICKTKRAIGSSQWNVAIGRRDQQEIAGLLEVVPNHQNRVHIFANMEIDRKSIVSEE